MEEKPERLKIMEYEVEKKDFKAIFSSNIIEPIIKFIEKTKIYKIFSRVPKIVYYFIGRGFSWEFFGEYKKEMVKTTRKIMGKLVNRKYREKTVEERDWVINEIVYHNTVYMTELFLEIIILLPYFCHVRDIDRFFKIKGLDYLDNALKKERGVILISGHIGNYLFMCCYLALKGYKINFILEYRSFRGILKLLKNCGIKLIPVPRIENNKIRNKIKKIIDKALDNNEIVVIMQDAGLRHYMLIDFFGEPCHTATGAISLALKHGSPIIPIFIRSQAKKHEYEISIYPEFKIERENIKNDKEIIYYNTYRLNKILEEKIRRNIIYWNNLAIYHIRKSFKKKNLFEQNSILDNLINEIQFFKDYLKFSYEVNRDDEKIEKILDEANFEFRKMKDEQSKS